jgi:hypothetical protein
MANDKYLMICSKVNNNVLGDTNHRVYDAYTPEANIKHLETAIEDTERQLARIRQGLKTFKRKCEQAKLMGVEHERFEYSS